MALDRYGNSKDALDSLDDSTIDWLHGLSMPEIIKEKQDSRLRRTKPYMDRVKEFTVKDLTKILNEVLPQEVKSTTNKKSFLKNIDEEINWIFKRFKINNFESRYGGMVYHIKDKFCNYPIFKTEFSTSEDIYRETWYKNPVVSPYVRVNIKIINLKKHISELMKKEIKK